VRFLRIARCERAGGAVELSSRFNRGVGVWDLDDGRGTVVSAGLPYCSLPPPCPQQAPAFGASTGTGFGASQVCVLTGCFMGVWVGGRQYEATESAAGC